MDESLLAGMHENIKFDRKYTMDISQMKVKDFSLGGYTTTTIAKDNVTEIWKIQMASEPKKFAITNGTLPPFGTQKYILSKDLGGGQIDLNINACDDRKEFNCQDGGCIPIEKRCNSKFDCVDGSDERTCFTIDVPSSYLKHVPDRDGAIVTINVDIESLFDISEVFETFSVKYQFTMIWQDQRITYLNLKKDSYLNAVANQEAKSIWIPITVFKNTHNKDQSKVNVEYNK